MHMRVGVRVRPLNAKESGTTHSIVDLSEGKVVQVLDPDEKMGGRDYLRLDRNKDKSISEELLALFHEQQNILKEMTSLQHNEKSLQIQLTWAQEQGKPAEEVEGLRERAKEEQSCLVALQADLQALRSKIDQLKDAVPTRVVSAHRLHMLKVLVNQQEARCDAQRFKGQARMKVQLAQQLLQVWDAELPPVFKQLMGGIFDIKPAAGAPTPSKAPAAGDDGETVCTGSPPTISTPPQ
eukprot:gene27087-33321_t